MINYITIGVLILLVLALAFQSWWILKTIKKLWLIKDLFAGAYEGIYSYVEHIKYVHGLERYYGDETLKGLIEHGESTRLSVEEFLEIFSEFEDLEEINLPGPDITDEELSVDDEETDPQENQI
jgi:hypothetical protein